MKKSKILAIVTAIILAVQTASFTVFARPQSNYTLCEVKEGNCTLIDNVATNQCASGYPICFATAYGVGRCSEDDVIFFENVKLSGHVSELVLRCGYNLGNSQPKGTGTEFWVYLSSISGEPVAIFSVNNLETKTSQIKDQVYKHASVSIAPGIYDVYIVAKTSNSGSCSELYFVYGDTGTTVAGSSVTVTIPTFPVSINGAKVLNRNAKYPCLVFKDITYFPMTYTNAMALGLSTSYTASSGLSITKNGAAPTTTHFQQNAVPNDVVQTAQVVTGNVTINGKVIDNSTEPYPLLLFRDITYFPLTWRFVNDEFGWQYSFTHKYGLEVFSN